MSIVRSDNGTCVEFGPTQLPVGLGLGLGLGLRLGLGLGLTVGVRSPPSPGLGLGGRARPRPGLGLGLRLELGLGLGLGPNLIDRKLGGPEPSTSALITLNVHQHSVHYTVCCQFQPDNHNS